MFDAWSPARPDDRHAKAKQLEVIIDHGRAIDGRQSGERVDPIDFGKWRIYRVRHRLVDRITPLMTILRNDEQ